MSNYYEVLGLSASDTHSVIKIMQAANLARAKLSAAQDKNDAQKKLKEINQAYDTLVNAPLKKAYDSKLAVETAAQQEAANTKFNQSQVRNKIIAYLNKENRDPEFIKLLDKGHCNGFASLWLYCKRLSFQARTSAKPRDDAEWFYQVMRMISNWDEKREFSIYERHQLERFISLLHFFQKNEFFTPYQQGELHKVIEDTKGNVINKEYSIAALLDIKQLGSLLDKIMFDDKMVLLVSDCHAVAALKHGGKYYFYDSNEKGGEVAHNDALAIANSFFDANSFSQVSPVGVRIYGVGTPAVYPEQKKLLDDLYGTNIPLQSVSGYANDVTALESACFIGCVESAKYYLDHGADPNLGTALANKVGHTPLHHAADGNHVELAELLIQKKAQVDAMNKDGVTPLALAAGSGRANIAALLVNRGANRAQADASGMTPAELAKKNNFPEIVKIIEKRNTKQWRTANRNRLFNQLKMTEAAQQAVNVAPKPLVTVS